MPKRRINKRQKDRIAAIQKRRQQKAQDRTNEAISDINPSDLGPEQMGLLIAHFGSMADVEDSDGQVHRCLLRQHLGILVAGDKVTWQSAPTGGVIVACQPRETILGRPDQLGNIKPIAANIDQMLIVAAPEPALTTLLLDSYLVAAHALSIEPIIVLNKIDLLSEDEKYDIEPIIEAYKQLAYKVIEVSTIQDHGLNDTQTALQDKTSVFVGQSGVGKSSIIGKLLPHETLETKPISKSTGLGSHTTTTARLYHLPTGGKLIDSPGIREFKLSHFTQRDILNGFQEMIPFMNTCQFRDCAHINELNCGLKEAVALGQISSFRFQNYLKLIALA